MAHARATIGTVRYAVSVEAGKHNLISDEPTKAGGQDAGPAPYDLLLASLGACTAITLRMYADRKQWVFDTLRVELSYGKVGETATIRRSIAVQGSLTAEQRARMAEIAERTPVTLTLKAGVQIVTEMA